MGYYLQMDRTSYDGKKEKIMTCTGITEAMVLKILDSVNTAGCEIKIYEEVNNELQNN